MTPASAIRAVIIFATLLGAGSGLSPSAAQELSTDVGFVEAVSGRVVAMTHGTPVLVDVSDVISDRTRFDLLANSELNLCHYRIGRFITLRGLRGSSFQKTG
jgi:hypothetical protein